VKTENLRVHFSLTPGFYTFLIAVVLYPDQIHNVEFMFCIKLKENKISRPVYKVLSIRQLWLSDSHKCI